MSEMIAVVTMTLIITLCVRSQLQPNSGVTGILRYLSVYDYIFGTETVQV